MKSNGLIISFIFALLTSGCASVQTGALFESESSKHPNEATVYIYRPDVFPASVISPMLFVDGEETSRLPELGYVPLTLTLGEHTLETKDEKSFISESVVSGYKFSLDTEGEYYIRWEPYVSDSATYYNPVTFATVIVKFAADVRMVPESEAIPEIQNYRKVLN